MQACSSELVSRLRAGGRKQLSPPGGVGGALGEAGGLGEAARSRCSGKRSRRVLPENSTGVALPHWGRAVSPRDRLAHAPRDQKESLACPGALSKSTCCEVGARGCRARLEDQRV